MLNSFSLRKLSKSHKMLLFYLVILFFPDIKSLQIIPSTIKNLKLMPNFENNACYNYMDYYSLFFNKNCYHDTRVLSNTESLIRENGYFYRSYEVTTSEGYILTVFRISKSETPGSGQPIFLQHGILTDSACFVQIRNRSLAFHLTELGFDVWLGNTRSTLYGKRHTLLKESDKQYWDYSLDNMAVDLRDCLLTVANETGKAGEIIYIGHSMGTSIGFMYASEHPEDNILKGIVALSPIVYFDVSSSYKMFVKSVPFLATTLRKYGVYNLLRNIKPAHVTFTNICKFFPHFCKFLAGTLFGPSNLFKPVDLTTHFSYFPDTVGVFQIDHYRQMIAGDRFARYDWGRDTNMERYGRHFAYQYDMGKIKLPVFLFYGKNDAFLSKYPIERLYEELGSSVKYQSVVPNGIDASDVQFGHVEFLVATNIESLFYKDLEIVMANLTSTDVEASSRIKNTLNYNSQYQERP